MSADEDAAAIALAKSELRRVMARIPFDLQTAGATRVAVWKELHWNAEKLLRKNLGFAYKYRYDELRIALEHCGSGPVDSIVKGVYDHKEGEP